MRPVRLALPFVLVLAALPAAGASASPHWGPPKQLVRAPADPATSVGLSHAVAAPGGALLAFGGDAANPVFLRGSIAGGLTAAKITTASKGTARGATGADGTIAAVWSDRTTGRLAVAGPAGDFATPIDLPGQGVNAIDVGVAANGAATVAWRTKTGASTYSVLVARLPKGGALGEPQVLFTGSNAVGGVDVAVAADGAAAVAFTRQAGGYQTYVAVQPAAAAAFEAPQRLSDAGGDLSPNVVFETDGTIVAAWGNSAGGRSAVRRPGQPSFAPAASLGSPAFSVDLVATPQGGSAVAFSGSDDVRAAIKAPGAETFAPAPVAAVPGNIPPAPAISVDAAGRPLVVFADSSDGSVKAITGGTTTTIGYGRPTALTPVAAAAGRADEAIALWTDAQGGLSSSTFGEGAPPATGPGAKPPARDRTAPKLRLVSSKRLRVSRRTTRLKLRFSCDEVCAIGASGALRTSPPGKRRRLAPVTPSSVLDARTRPAGTQTVTVALGKLALADLRRALKAKRGAQLYLTAVADDVAHNQRKVSVLLSLRAAPTRKARSRR